MSMLKETLRDQEAQGESRAFPVTGRVVLVATIQNHQNSNVARMYSSYSTTNWQKNGTEVLYFYAVQDPLLLKRSKYNQVSPLCTVNLASFSVSKVRLVSASLSLLIFSYQLFP